MLKITAGFSVIFLLLSLSLAYTDGTLTAFAQERESNIPDIVQVGVMLPSTGDLAAHGQDNGVGVEYGLTKFNEYLEEIGAHWRMELVKEDTQSDPIVALEKIQSLNSKGIKFILGPESSAEVRNVKSYADSNDMVLISPTSTSPALAIDDNIFRMIPDDTQQGKVLAELFEEQDIKVVVPMYRGDVWGDGLFESTKMNFEALGGVMDDGLRYSPDVTVYSTEANLLSGLVADYVAEYSTDDVAVLLIGFSEAVHILNFADSYENLHEVRWFGSDGSSNDSTLSGDPISAAFTQDVNFVSTQFATSTNEIYEDVKAHFIDFKGSTPNAYAYSSYDSVAVLGKTILETGSVDPLTIKDSIIEVAATHTGAIGTVNLNEAGDLAISDYDLWGIQDGTWYLYGHYNAGTGVFDYTADEMVMDDDDKEKVDEPGGGCLIATAAYGSELAPQVQLLREIRGDTLMSSDVGSSFMTEFNQFYYMFSPTVADLQRNNVIFGDAVRTVITPGIYTLGAVMGLADSNEESVLAYGILSIVTLLGIYIIGPILAVFGIRILVRKMQSKYQSGKAYQIKN